MQKSVRAGQPQYMPYIPYSMPKDPRQIMADFYLLTTVGDIAKSAGENWRIAFDPERTTIQGKATDLQKLLTLPTRQGLNYEKYGQNLEDAVQKLTQGMKKHMLDSLLFSISAELRHYKANRQPEELLDNPFMKAYSKIYDAYDAVADKNLPEYAQKYLKPMYPETPRARISKGSRKSYQLSNAAVRKAFEETGISISEFADIAEKLFREGNWNKQFGGENWGNIAAGLQMVDQANDPESLIKALDNAYDLQHNTGVVFDKIQKYAREGGYQWLQDMLDFKYHAGSPREFASLASSAAKRITAPALIDIGDIAIDKRRENAVAVAGEDTISDIEDQIRRLKPNRENIYQDINVKAPKYTGKDINEELQKWLVNTTTSGFSQTPNKLKKLGVNSDVIQYVRLLLAQKMAPKWNVPQDIKEMVSKSVAKSKAKNQTEVEYGPPIGIPEKSNLAKVPAPVKEGGNIIPADIGELKQQIHKLMHLHTESDIGTMVPYKGLMFSGMKNIPANTFTIKIYKDGTKIDEATFNLKSPVYDNSVYAYLYYNTPVKEQTKAENLADLALPSQDIKWTPVYSGKGEYVNFVNGDEPISTDMTAYFDGKPLFAEFILDGDALHIKTEKGDDYSIPFSHESSADAKSSFIQQMLGKYTDIVSDIKEYEGIDLSFTPPKPASLAQTKAPSSEPSLSPDFRPVAMTIEQLKQLIVNPKTGEISTQPLKILINTELNYFPEEKKSGLAIWGTKYAEWAKKASAEELWPSVTGKPYEDVASQKSQSLKSEDQAIADYKDYKKFKYDQWYADQSKKLKEKLPDEVVKTILDFAWVQTDTGSTIPTVEEVFQKVKNKLGNLLLSTDDIKLLNESIDSAIGEAAKGMFSVNPTSLEKIPSFMNSQKVMELYEAVKAGISWDDTEGGESISDNLEELNLSELSDENIEELKKWYNSVLDYENEKKEFYGEFKEETNEQKNAETDPEVDYYKKAFNEFVNYDWKELSSGPEFAKDLVEYLFGSKDFDFAMNRTISVGRKFLVPYAPGGDKVYILHGKDQNIDGSVIFDMSKKTKEQTKQEMIDWVAHFIDYYDPKI